MSENSMCDDIDIKLLHALQINPRAPWTRLAPVLGVDSTALSRRWAALTEARVAWSACFPAFEQRRQRLRVMALVELQVSPGTRESVIEAVSTLPEIISAHCTSGDRDLYLTLVGPDVAAIDQFVDEQISCIVGVARIQTTYVRRTLHEGSSWRLRALTSNQIHALEDTLPESARRATFGPTYLQVIEAMQSDVRRSVTDIAQETGRSQSSISRAIDAIVSNGWASLRIDFAERTFGWTVSALLWLRVPPEEVERVGTTFRLIPQARFSASVAGPANLVATLWLRDLVELEEIEMRLTKVFPTVEVRDRWIVPRIAKRAGHILDTDGRCVRFIPTDIPSWLPDQ